MTNGKHNERNGRGYDSMCPTQNINLHESFKMYRKKGERKKGEEREGERAA